MIKYITLCFTSLLLLTSCSSVLTSNISTYDEYYEKATKFEEKVLTADEFTFKIYKESQTLEEGFIYRTVESYTFKDDYFEYTDYIDGLLRSHYKCDYKNDEYIFQKNGETESDPKSACIEEEERAKENVNYEVELKMKSIKESHINRNGSSDPADYEKFYTKDGFYVHELVSQYFAIANKTTFVKISSDTNRIYTIRTGGSEIPETEVLEFIKE